MAKRTKTAKKASAPKNSAPKNSAPKNSAPKNSAQETSTSKASPQSAVAELPRAQIQPAARREQDAPQIPWRLLGEARCRCCNARYRVTEAPLTEMIFGWYRCGVCATTVERWAAPAARAYTPI